MSDAPFSRDLQGLYYELDMVVELLAITPVLSPEWDQRVKKYLDISFQICMMTGDISTCDSINY